jgi:hypothetical protein
LASLAELTGASLFDVSAACSSDRTGRGEAEVEVEVEGVAETADDDAVVFTPIQCLSPSGCSTADMLVEAVAIAVSEAVVAALPATVSATVLLLGGMLLLLAAALFFLLVLLSLCFLGARGGNVIITAVVAAGLAAIAGNTVGIDTDAAVDGALITAASINSCPSLSPTSSIPATAAASASILLLIAPSLLAVAAALASGLPTG